MPTYTTYAGRTITTDGQLGKGGEGTVYGITSNNDEVVKSLKPDCRTSEKESKLQAMIDNPPRDDMRGLSSPHVSIAWPTELVRERGRFAGFLMPRISQSLPIFQIYNPAIRARKQLDFNWWDLHHTARNIATALNALHACGHVMGDVNESNVLGKTSRDMIESCGSRIS